MGWQPTNELRFVRRYRAVVPDNVWEASKAEAFLVLQQKWTRWEFYDWEEHHEWRDVPIETEHEP